MKLYTIYLRTLDKLKDWYYNLDSRKRMRNLFKDFYSFDLCGTIPDVMFGIFREFYEHGNIDFVDWLWNEEVENKRKMMDKIYLYIKYLRPKWIKKSDHVLSLSTIELKFKPCEDDQNLSECYFENESERNDKIYKIHSWVENFIWECDNKYMKEIINLRGSLWV